MYLIINLNQLKTNGLLKVRAIFSLAATVERKTVAVLVP